MEHLDSSASVANDGSEVIKVEEEETKPEVHEEPPDGATHIKSFNDIHNKHLRRIKIHKHLREKKKAKKEERKRRQKAGEPKQVPKTIESTREPDETTVGDLEDEENLEVRQDLAQDEFSNYFEKLYEPKVLITTSDNPCSLTRVFCKELSRMVPNSYAKCRNRSSMKKMVRSCIKNEFTDIIVINENMRRPNGLVLIHLPDGPTAHFKLSSVKITKDLNRSHKAISQHRPEVILNNFGTRLGTTVSRMLAALFHYDPQFKGRRAVTFHNQRDFIFFRHHMYEFKPERGKVQLRELGPRFTLKLRSLQQGTFDSKTGEFEWIIADRRHEMETSRRRFFL